MWSHPWPTGYKANVQINKGMLVSVVAMQYNMGMVDGVVYGLALATALGCGLSGGALFAFSAFVMNGLGRLPAPQGIAAMQRINDAAPTPAFMLALFLPALASVVLTVMAVASWDEPGARHLVVGSVLYLVMVVGLTAGYHVPRNNRLASVEPDSDDGAVYWERYQCEWTRMNHLRALGGLAAAAAFTLALGTT